MTLLHECSVSNNPRGIGLAVGKTSLSRTPPVCLFSSAQAQRTSFLKLVFMHIDRSVSPCCVRTSVCCAFFGQAVCTALMTFLHGCSGTNNPNAGLVLRLHIHELLLPFIRSVTMYSSVSEAQREASSRMRQLYETNMLFSIPYHRL